LFSKRDDGSRRFNRIEKERRFEKEANSKEKVWQSTGLSTAHRRLSTTSNRK